MLKVEIIVRSSLFSSGCPIAQHHLLDRLYFVHWNNLESLFKTNWPYIYVWVCFWISILFHWSSLSFFCQYYCYSFILFRNQDMLTFQFYSFSKLLVILFPYTFYINFRVSLLISTEKAIWILTGIIIGIIV